MKFSTEKKKLDWIKILKAPVRKPGSFESHQLFFKELEDIMRKKRMRAGEQ
jgi:hypothetical protein